MDSHGSVPPQMDSDVQLSTAGELVDNAVIKAPAGQADIELDLIAAEADWMQENLYIE